MVLGFACMLMFLVVDGCSQALEKSVNAPENQPAAASISNDNFIFASRKLLLLANSTAEMKEDLNDIFNGSGGGDQDYNFVGGPPTTPTDFFNFASSPPDSDNVISPPDSDNVISPPTGYYTYVGTPPDAPTGYYNYVGTPPGLPTNRIGPDEPCSNKDLLLFQDQTEPMPDGIPTYTVRVCNVCSGGSCCISNIHLSCGWYSSARLVDPSVLRRLDYDDCLLNDGGALGPGEAVTFTYANTYSYPMKINSISCGNC